MKTLKSRFVTALVLSACWLSLSACETTMSAKSGGAEIGAESSCSRYSTHGADQCNDRTGCHWDLAKSSCAAH